MEQPNYIQYLPDELVLAIYNKLDRSSRITMATLHRDIYKAIYNSSRCRKELVKIGLQRQIESDYKGSAKGFYRVKNKVERFNKGIFIFSFLVGISIATTLFFTSELSAEAINAIWLTPTFIGIGIGCVLMVAEGKRITELINKEKEDRIAKIPQTLFFKEETQPVSIINVKKPNLEAQERQPLLTNNNRRYDFKI